MEVNFSALRLHLVPPTLSRLCRLSVVFCPRAQLWRPRRVVHESSRIDTNSIQIREIRVNSWTVTSVQAHFALGHLEGRGRSDFVSRRKVGRVSCRPQGAFVAGGARRRRLSWSRQ